MTGVSWDQIRVRKVGGFFCARLAGSAQGWRLFLRTVGLERTRLVAFFAHGWLGAHKVGCFHAILVRTICLPGALGRFSVHKVGAISTNLVHQNDNLRVSQRRILFFRTLGDGEYPTNVIGKDIYTSSPFLPRQVFINCYGGVVFPFLMSPMNPLCFCRIGFFCIHCIIVRFYTITCVANSNL